MTTFIKRLVATTFIFLLMVSSHLISAQTINLYGDKIPNSIDGPDNEKTENNGMTLVSQISRPSLTIYGLPKATKKRTAVVICPGGGYWVNAIAHEGHDVAKKLNESGVVAFVLKYRIPNTQTMVNKEIGAFQDAQQAIRYVREHALELNIDPNRIGIMGFSAGGHLASTASTHYNHNYVEGSSATNLRPDFSILIYPVISFTDSLTHTGSREQIIGKNPSAEKVREYSNEMQVDSNTPPAFLVHASDDDVVPVGNSIAYYQALTKNKVPAELHIYQKGGHGFGMKNPTTHDLWMERCINWMKATGLFQ